jgi:hypothetical protein
VLSLTGHFDHQRVRLRLLAIPSAPTRAGAPDAPENCADRSEHHAHVPAPPTCATPHQRHQTSTRLLECCSLRWAGRQLPMDPSAKQDAMHARTDSISQSLHNSRSLWPSMEPSLQSQFLDLQPSRGDLPSALLPIARQDYHLHVAANSVSDNVVLHSAGLRSARPGGSSRADARALDILPWNAVQAQYAQGSGAVAAVLTGDSRARSPSPAGSSAKASSSSSQMSYDKTHYIPRTEAPFQQPDTWQDGGCRLPEGWQLCRGCRQPLKSEWSSKRCPHCGTLVL